MKEAIGNMLHVDCDALVVTTNGFVKKDGSCVMGRGIAKQLATHIPELPYVLGKAIKQHGNRVFKFNFEGINETIITFPVKPVNGISDGTNVVAHMMNQFPVGSVVCGFAMKAEPTIIEQSLKELVQLVDKFGFEDVICPRFGCGAGELQWAQIKPLAESYLDDRFTSYTFK